MNTQLDTQSNLYYISNKQKLLNMTLLTLIFPLFILMYFALDKEVNIPINNIPVMIICSIILFIYYSYNIAEILHIIVYWTNPLKLTTETLSYLTINKNYKNINLNEVYTITIYKKRKKPNLIEFKDKNNKSLGTVYLKGFSYTHTNKLLAKIKHEHKQIIFQS